MGLVALARLAGAVAALTGLGILGLAAVPAAAAAATGRTLPARPAAPGPGSPLRADSVPGRGTMLGRSAVPAPGSATAIPPERSAPDVPATAQFVVAPHAISPAGGDRQVCPTPTRPGQMTCMALVPSRAKAPGPDLSSSDGYQPAQLQEAYGLTLAAASAGHGETVAVVDAFGDPVASKDLAAYRSHFGLPACTTSSVCLKIVNQAGQAAPLPRADSSGGWELEESVDLDMVSAICPNCSILLVEAKSDSISDLATAERYAAGHAGVVAVSNSWGSGAEFTGENSFDADFNKPGVAIAAASGDDGYGTQYPAVSQFVTAVGGTTLTGATSTRRGTEKAWSGTGSGCSALEAKPAWQVGANVSPGCRNRTENDVSADADPNTGVVVYDTFAGAGGWNPLIGGTSVSTPIIAAAYALAGKLRPRTYPASYPYLHASDLTDVKSGSNGSCEQNRRYLCRARAGYDGPTGLGTPDGTGAFAGPAAEAVTVVNPGTRDYAASSPVRLHIRALDSKRNRLRYSSTSLPAGLRLNSANGVISGRLTSRPGSHSVKVTASAPGKQSGSVTFVIEVISKIVDRHRTAGQVRLDLGGKCLTDAHDSAASGTKIEIWKCGRNGSQKWTYIPGSGPGAPGLLKIHGKCLSIRSGTGNGARATLQGCTSAAGQKWAYRSLDNLYNPHSGKCLADPGKSRANGRQVELWSCSTSVGESWMLPAAQVLSGVAGKCLTDPRDSASSGTRIEIAGCRGSRSQKWVVERNGELRIRGKCLTVSGGRLGDGAPIELAACSRSQSEQWSGGPAGQLLNVNSGRCLADPASRSASGTKLAQEDCYGEPGEIWAVS